MNGSATEQEGHGTAVAYRTADAVKRNEEGGGQGTTRGKEGDEERRGGKEGDEEGRGNGKQAGGKKSGSGDGRGDEGRDNDR